MLYSKSFIFVLFNILSLANAASDMPVCSDSNPCKEGVCWNLIRTVKIDSSTLGATGYCLLPEQTKFSKKIEDINGNNDHSHGSTGSDDNSGSIINSSDDGSVNNNNSNNGNNNDDGHDDHDHSSNTSDNDGSATTTVAASVTRSTAQSTAQSNAQPNAQSTATSLPNTNSGLDVRHVAFWMILVSFVATLL